MASGNDLPGLIALCGIDGTGKSTQADLLQRRVSDTGATSAVLWCRWDPWLALPAIRALDYMARRSAKAAVVGTDTNGITQTRRAIRSGLLERVGMRKLWTAMMVIDYSLQVAPSLWKARRSSDVVIVDRYRYDVIVDLSAGGELRTTPRLLRWLLPDPDVTIVLEVAEDVALARKPDSPDLKYLTQRRALYALVAAHEGATVVDAGSSVIEVSDAIFAAVLFKGNWRDGSR